MCRESMWIAWCASRLMGSGTDSDQARVNPRLQPWWWERGQRGRGLVVESAALVHARPYGNKRVFLTLLGGGAFSNDIALGSWPLSTVPCTSTSRQIWNVVLASYARRRPRSSPCCIAHTTAHGDHTRTCRHPPAACARVACGIWPRAATRGMGTRRDPVEPPKDIHGGAESVARSRRVRGDFSYWEGNWR
jgi:hypothetical protein